MAQALRKPTDPAGYGLCDAPPQSVSDAMRAARMDLVGTLESLDAAQDRQMVITSAVVDHGGTLIQPHSQGTWGPLNCELELLGIFGIGPDEEAAIANWCTAATRIEIALQETEAA